jgi:hypothetical protein
VPVYTGTRVAVRRVDLVTSTPGFQAEIYGADTVPGDIGAWTKVSKRTNVGETQHISVATRGRKYRYYLVWIVSLPGGNRADVRELGLKK